MTTRSHNGILFSPPPVKPEGTIGLHSVRQSVRPSVRPSHSFSGPFFAMLSHTWMQIGSKIPIPKSKIEKLSRDIQGEKSVTNINQKNWYHIYIVNHSFYS